ncbi:hypothetical protein [Aliidiomarina quisquiliarum]|uniref:hypothetical protein n=1 Tax=Aliidiomarina quisquiliarum TaxID=2938947 RepID=UPI00208E1F71|nr:hypothetical protein [Aliidiomarina quisquiliarum]MCO4319966.1 hypothetical protein [Aliidiomarina quisquiliarum]
MSNDLETRIVVAAGRALQRAPTIALAALKKTAIQSRMREVGYVQMNTKGRMSVTITDKALYDQWEAKYSPSE